jgi:outer membrane protein assembly factor BamA
MKTLTTIAALLLPLQVPAQSTDEPPAQPAVQEIRCVGNEHTSCVFLRDHLYLRVGDKLDEDEIRNAELRLSALRNFESARIRLEKGADRGAVIVVIEVAEADPIAMEWIAGGSARAGTDRVVAGGRIANQNLFGAGKYADLSALAVVPVGGLGESESYDVTLRYADPHLFDSRRWFGVATAGYRKSRYEDRYGNTSFAEFPQFSATLGWRFGDFSYLLAGTSYRPGIEWHFSRWQSDGTYQVSRERTDYESTINLVYGWSSEDDLHFPTQGSTFQLAAGGDYGSQSPNSLSHVQFRKTWQAANAYWTFKLGGDPSPEYRNSFDESQLLSLTYARAIAGGDEVKRGRWYIEPGISSVGYSESGGTVIESGLKIGWRADTRSFGIVDLYLIGTADGTW